ncbi:hypothetical protein A2V49_00555 [candidate division WWE3 bacterium RBG_19FT_COMBO_34_6]|uniref:Uncharacterized protein n=1 Tax=candidate division WWE3 bacterium RBG_19FT_COMBO_34_6 TaxID=1802612 RepID=A0A1F4UNJ8_UNCKA|nr:MAG: hypothetical protein A2V49_00555 [candidate division WWE3 bacterium RBG_19FT_COMBO_34_6]
MKKAILIFIIFFIYVYLNNIYIKLFIADSYFILAKNSTSSGDYVKSIKYINTAIQNNPQEPTYHRESAKIRLTGLQNFEVESKNYIGYKKKILKELVKARELNRYNLATIRNSIPLYYFLTIKDLNRSGSKDNIDEQYLQITKEFFSGLKNLYPNDLGLFVDVAKYEKKLGLTEDFNYSLSVIIKLRPDIVTWNENLR